MLNPRGIEADSGGPRAVGGVTFDVHTVLYAGGRRRDRLQSIGFAVFTKCFAINVGLMPESRRMSLFFRLITLETGLIVGAALVLVGLVVSVATLSSWGARAFGELDPRQTLRMVVPGVVALTLGFQIVLSSFFLSVLGMSRRR